MPLSEVAGRDGTAAPAHMVSDVPKGKTGVIFGSTVTVKVTGVAQIPAEGVKVYVPEEALLTVAGLQVPVTPFVEVLGNEGTVPPAHNDRDVPKLNTGMVFGFTVILNVAEVAHCPAAGVNV